MWAEGRSAATSVKSDETLSQFLDLAGSCFRQSPHCRVHTSAMRLDQTRARSPRWPESILLASTYKPCAFGTPLVPCQGMPRLTSYQVACTANSPLHFLHHPCAFGTPLAPCQGMPRLTSYQVACTAIKCSLDKIKF
jgi:hypothetical protein